MRYSAVLFPLPALSRSVSAQLFTNLFSNRTIPLVDLVPASAIFHDVRSELKLAKSFGYGDFGYLFERQESCNPGYAPCSNLPGYCCPAGETCFTEGCCQAGNIPCAGLGCYDPSTEVCCSNGHNCPLGYDCLSGGDCCPHGHLPCGNSKCYDPTIDICCISSGTAYGCSKDKECCTAGGAVSCYDTSTEQCCPGGSCPKEDSCCGNECCTEIASCGSDGWCTRIAPTSSTVTPSPTFETVSEVASATETSIGGDDGFNGRTIPFKYDPDRKVMGKDGILYEAVNKAVLTNMCIGIKTYLGYTSQSIILTRVSESQRRKNRRTMCPTGWCADALKEYLSDYYPDGIPEAAQEAITLAQDMSCDEFPFAISAEGGNLATGIRFCIPSAENSWQGGVMSNYFKKIDGIAVGEKFKVEIVGFDCDTLSPTMNIIMTPRDLGPTMVDSSDMWKGYDQTNPSNNLIPIPLGDLSAGDYVINLNISGGSPDISVVTYDGRAIDSNSNSDGIIYFSLIEDEDAVSAIGIITQDTSISIDYSLQSSNSSSSVSSASTASSPTGASNASRMTVGMGFISFTLVTMIYLVIL